MRAALPGRASLPSIRRHSLSTRLRRWIVPARVTLGALAALALIGLTSATLSALQPDAATGGRELITAAATQAAGIDPATLPPLLRPESWPNTLGRLLQFAAILGIIGAATFRLVLMPGAALMPTPEHRLKLGVRRFTVTVLLLLLITLPLRLWLQSAFLHGPESALQADLLGSLLTELTWGQAWLTQLGAAGLAGVAVVTGFLPLLAIAALALAFTPAFQGHAAAVEPLRFLAISADGVHVLAVGIWLGTLAVLFTTAMPVLFRDGMERGGHDTARLLARFSPLALTAATILALAGAVSALLRLHTPAELLTDPWGRAFLLKLGLVILVLLAGWYNWKRARPALPLHTGVRALRLAALLELLLATAVLAVTALLVALPTP